MKNLRELFEYQKFNPNPHLQAKIDEITGKYLSNGIELSDDELNVAAAGDPYQSNAFPEKQDENKT